MKRIFLNSLLLILVLLDIVLLVLSQKLPYDRPELHEVVEDDKITVIRLAKKNYSENSRFAELIEEYNKDNQDGIRIEVIKLSTTNYQTELNYLMTSSEEPDIMNIEADWIRTYIEKRWLIDLLPYIEEDMLGNQTHSVIDFLSTYTLDNEIFVLPTSLTTYRLMYNARLFEKYNINDKDGPKTFQDLVDFTEVISREGKDKNVYGFVLPLKDPLEGFKKNLEIPSTLSGINYYNITTERVDFTVYSQWFEMIREMINQNTILPGYENIDMNLALNQFAEENVGMVYVSSEDCPTIQKLYSKESDWRIILPPEYKSGSNQLIMNYSNYYGISVNTKEKEKAVLVWKYLNSKEHIQKLYLAGENIPIDHNALFLNSMENQNFMFKSFLPTQKEILQPAYLPEAENLHRFDTYLKCLTSTEAIKELLVRENFYVRKNLQNK